MFAFTCRIQIQILTFDCIPNTQYSHNINVSSLLGPQSTVKMLLHLLDDDYYYCWHFHMFLINWRSHFLFSPFFYSIHTMRNWQCVFRFKFPDKRKKKQPTQNKITKNRRYQFAIVIVWWHFFPIGFLFPVKDFFNHQNSTIQMLCCCYFFFFPLTLYVPYCRLSRLISGTIVNRFVFVISNHVLWWLNIERSFVIVRCTHHINSWIG